MALRQASTTAMKCDPHRHLCRERRIRAPSSPTATVQVPRACPKSRNPDANIPAKPQCKCLCTTTPPNHSASELCFRNLLDAIYSVCSPPPPSLQSLNGGVSFCVRTLRTLCSSSCRTESIYQKQSRAAWTVGWSNFVPMDSKNQHYEMFFVMMAFFMRLFPQTFRRK